MDHVTVTVLCHYTMASVLQTFGSLVLLTHIMEY